MRDPSKLHVFHLAHRFVLDVYRLTEGFPASERFNLQGQIRRTCVSTSTNIVEGCARTSRGEYAHFLSVALGSAVEARYLLDLSMDLAILPRAAAAECRASSDLLVRKLHNLHASLRDLDGQ